MHTDTLVTLQTLTLHTHTDTYRWHFILLKQVLSTWDTLVPWFHWSFWSLKQSPGTMSSRSCKEKFCELSANFNFSDFFFHSLYRVKTSPSSFAQEEVWRLREKFDKVWFSYHDFWPLIVLICELAALTEWHILIKHVIEIKEENNVDWINSLTCLYHIKV